MQWFRCRGVRTPRCFKFGHWAQFAHNWAYSRARLLEPLLSDRSGIPWLSGLRGPGLSRPRRSGREAGWAVPRIQVPIQQDGVCQTASGSKSGGRETSSNRQNPDMTRVSAVRGESSDFARRGSGIRIPSSPPVNLHAGFPFRESGLRRVGTRARSLPAEADGVRLRGD